MEDPRNARRNYPRENIDRDRYHLAKSPAPNREIRRVDSILRDVLADLETETQSEDTNVLRDAWPQLVGEQIARHSVPASLEKHVLRVNVDHPGWMPEMERIKRVLLQKLQARYRELRIRQLRFILIHR